MVELRRTVQVPGVRSLSRGVRTAIGNNPVHGSAYLLFAGSTISFFTRKILAPGKTVSALGLREPFACREHHNAWSD